MQVTTVTSALEVIKSQLETSFSKTIFIRIIKWLETNFGTPLLIEIHSEIYPTENNEYLKIASLIKKLQLNHALGSITKDRRHFFDEPNVITYHALAFPEKKIFEGCTAGFDLFSEEKAISNTLNEHIKNYAWARSEFYASTLRQGTLAEALHFKGLSSTALNALLETNTCPNNPQRRVLNDTIYGWTKTQSLLTGSSVFLPVQLISKHYSQIYTQNLNAAKAKTSQIEPEIHKPLSIGLAAGPTKEQSLVQGILQNIARDACLKHFFQKITPPKINLIELAKQDFEIQLLLELTRRYGLDIQAYKIQTDAPAHVVSIAILDNTHNTNPAITFGAKANLNFITCIKEAATQALAIRVTMRNKLDAGINFNKVKKAEDDARLLFWSDPDHISRIDFFTSGLVKNFSTEKNFSTDSDKNDLKKMITYLKTTEKELLFIKLSDSELEKLGFYVTNTLMYTPSPHDSYGSIPPTHNVGAGHVSNTETPVNNNRDPHPFLF